jgi:hypothetical protein
MNENRFNFEPRSSATPQFRNVEAGNTDPRDDPSINVGPMDAVSQVANIRREIASLQEKQREIWAKEEGIRVRINRTMRMYYISTLMVFFMMVTVLATVFNEYDVMISVLTLAAGLTFGYSIGRTITRKTMAPIPH